MNAVDRAIEAIGGRRQLAEACGVRYQAVQKWHRNGKVPAERVLEIERATGVPRTALRPDIYPPNEKTRKRAAA